MKNMPREGLRQWQKVHFAKYMLCVTCEFPALFNSEMEEGLVLKSL